MSHPFRIRHWARECVWADPINPGELDDQRSAATLDGAPRDTTESRALAFAQVKVEVVVIYGPRLTAASLETSDLTKPAEEPDLDARLARLDGNEFAIA